MTDGEVTLTTFDNSNIPGNARAFYDQLLVAGFDAQNCGPADGCG